jgi:hypothetical protein
MGGAVQVFVDDEEVSSGELPQRALDVCAEAHALTLALGPGDAVVKRLLRRPTKVAEARFDWLDDAASERPEWIAAFLEMKTVWHPIGG